MADKTGERWRVEKRGFRRHVVTDGVMEFRSEDGYGAIEKHDQQNLANYLNRLDAAETRRREEAEEHGRWLLQFVPAWVKTEAPDGLDPMWYGTHTAEGDRAEYARYQQALAALSSREQGEG